jgi:norsolorinic acid ketoreductase
MTTTKPTIYFITGANRGLGYGFVETLASRANTIVFATTRNPSAPSSSDLVTLAKSNPNVHILKLESTSVEDAQAAAEFVKKTTNKIDVVIANAAIAHSYHPILSTPLHKFNDHFQTNAVGVVILFQALHPLLKESSIKKFIPISSMAGTITNRPPFPMAGYGTSKAALNYITAAIHSEHSPEGLIAFPVHPGLVESETGKQGIEVLFGGNPVPAEYETLTPRQSAEKVVEFIDAATVEKHGGRFWSYDGSELKY